MIGNEDFNKMLNEALKQLEKKTNADRIRAMTDEELADEFIRIYNQLPRYTDSWLWLREWLKQEIV